MSKPTIDTDLMQVSAEISELRKRLVAYLTQREKERYTALVARMAQLSRVIKQREQEHTEGER
jgi:ribosomal protein S15P/S13E